MTRHVIDHQKILKGSRLAKFARIERQRGVKVQPEVAALRRAPKPTHGALRLKRFLAIERAGL